MSPLPINGTTIAVLAALLAIVAYLAADIMGLFPSKTHFHVEGRTVVITGGSQGMGKAVAKLLAKKGANVVIVARDRAKLESALQEIKVAAKSPSQRFDAISADMTDPNESIRVLSQVTSWNSNSAPDIVWANAGSAHPSFFASTPISTLRSQMDINYWAAAYLSHAALNLFLRRGPSQPSSDQPRHIIMTSSVVAFTPLAGYSPYSPAKAAMRNLADALRMEVQLYSGARRQASSNARQVPATDVKIHIVLPGTILSPGFEAEEKVKHPVTRILEKDDVRQSEEEVARAAIEGLEAGRFMVTTSWMGTLLRGASIGVSPRENVVLDTIMAWIAAIVWLFATPDLDGKVWKYGKQHGLEGENLEVK